MERFRTQAAQPAGPRLPRRPGPAKAPPGAATSLAMTFLIVLASGGLLLLSSFVGDAKARRHRHLASSPGPVLALRDAAVLDAAARLDATRPGAESGSGATSQRVARTR